MTFSPAFAQLKATALAELAKPVSAVYSGKPGCACGCRGNYSSHTRTVTQIKNKIRAQIELATAEEMRGLLVIPGSFVAIDNAGVGEATRTYTAYTDGRTS
ncbi:hypothetical protein SEA_SCOOBYDOOBYDOO_46 [Mycobacterium phage ScoobyDoobyDoo]|nr:hypothetical protein SEA_SCOOBYDOOBYDOO_46 [Mycobacterium phage ScoobyDoobyDoo]